MKANSKYDIIIAGGGLSGTSLCYELVKEGYKGSILLVDQDFGIKNSKTWCFWSNGEPPFPNLISNTWRELHTKVLGSSIVHELENYEYHCIKSGDYFRFIHSEIEKYSNVTLLEAGISKMWSVNEKPFLETDKEEVYGADYIFQSALPPHNLKKKHIKYPLIQHFLGWEVQTKKPFFDDKQATFMDFDSSWEKGIAFMYVLPETSRKALLEYTIFSGSVEDISVYEEKISNYLTKKLGLTPEDFEINRTEYGEIPMEHRPYLPWYESNIMNLGTSAGLSKPSTGYTFIRIQEHVKLLAKSLIKGKTPVLPTQSKVNFRYYDLLLLHILSTSTNYSLNVFKSLFKNNSIEQVFKFLDEKTNFAEDLKIMSSVPYTPFFKAILKNLKV